MKKKLKSKPSIKNHTEQNDELMLQHDDSCVTMLYKDWFLDYASYVILERAVPRIEDGLKPVQRRILHATKEMDDGKFNKVANIIGQTMQYHPHGDASIADAIVNLGQKELLFETQGNWGDARTGDSAAAPRYIETRLSKFALDVMYNPQTTIWQSSYDGRKKEPVTLPVKFPLLLIQGVEGIAVGLSTRILPHNFCEIIKASIDIIKGGDPKIYPDFSTGGVADFSDYNQGMRGGKVKIRAKIEAINEKKLLIKEIPYGTTTHALIDSIIKANEKGKINIKQVIDNTARDVEIEVCLAPNQHANTVIQALYAFTDCETSVSPNACVIIHDKPCFVSVIDILRENTQKTMHLLKKELITKENELLEKIFFLSIEKIFIEKRIYRHIESCDTFEKVVLTIQQGLLPYTKELYRPLERDDIIKLTEIKIKRISKYDVLRGEKNLKALTKDLKETRRHLKRLDLYAIDYYQNLFDKYAEGRERKTKITHFQSITASKVIAANQKLYLQRSSGFVGWGLKKDEYVGECSQMADIIVLRKDGVMMVCRVGERVYMGKEIIYVGVWAKGDMRTVYNMVYTDGVTKKSFVKRFNIPAVIRDKEYHLTQGHKGSRVNYLSVNLHGEAEIISVKLAQTSKARKKFFKFDFASLDIKGRLSKGNMLTSYAIRRIELNQKGAPTLQNLEWWFNPTTFRLNADQEGSYVGSCNVGETILSIDQSGIYKLTPFDVDLVFDNAIIVKKFDEQLVITAVYVDTKSSVSYVKRFAITTSSIDKPFSFLPTTGSSKLLWASVHPHPIVTLTILKGKKLEKNMQIIKLHHFVQVKGWKARGKILSSNRIDTIRESEGKETVLEATSVNESKSDTTKQYKIGQTIKLEF